MAAELPAEELPELRKGDAIEYQVAGMWLSGFYFGVAVNSRRELLVCPDRKAFDSKRYVRVERAYTRVPS